MFNQNNIDYLQLQKMGNSNDCCKRLDLYLLASIWNRFNNIQGQGYFRNCGTLYLKISRPITKKFIEKTVPPTCHTTEWRELLGSHAWRHPKGCSSCWKRHPSRLILCQRRYFLEKKERQTFSVYTLV